eukprot:scaffold439_cov415-Prasinococcus_capsulatus_cf.AAC.39
MNPIGRTSGQSARPVSAPGARKRSAPDSPSAPVVREDDCRALAASSAASCPHLGRSIDRGRLIVCVGLALELEATGAANAIAVRVRGRTRAWLSVASVHSRPRSHDPSTTPECPRGAREEAAKGGRCGEDGSLCAHQTRTVLRTRVTGSEDRIVRDGGRRSGALASDLL